MRAGTWSSELPYRGISPRGELCLGQRLPLPAPCWDLERPSGVWAGKGAPGCDALQVRPLLPSCHPPPRNEHLLCLGSGWTECDCHPVEFPPCATTGVQIQRALCHTQGQGMVGQYGKPPGFSCLRTHFGFTTCTSEPFRVLWLGNGIDSVTFISNCPFQP